MCATFYTLHLSVLVSNHYKSFGKQPRFEHLDKSCN